jgi:alpha-L-arabinofuranosidase
MFTRRSFLGALSACCALVKTGNLGTAASLSAREYHVSPLGSDTHHGTAARPFKTIAAAAARAVAGDTITVHAGTYRERVAPPRGGSSDADRIIYQAAPGERVEITGAEIIKNWARWRGDAWTVVIPNSFFGAFNPYSDAIHGDWFDARGRVHHTGTVYLNSEWLAEASNLDEVADAADATPLWFGQVDDKSTTLWAQFRGADPNQEKVEINVRRSVFYPEKTGVDYITVRGFILRCAATPWAPPTAEQIGLIGTHWSKGWIIEDNVVSYSICSGISLGKYADQWDNTSANSAEGYVKTIERAEQAGWSSERIGHHLVRNNTISHCEQAGIVGSLGPVFSSITGNTIHDIHVRQLFSGAEMAGIKFHAAIDAEISHNHIYACNRGLWLDWMAQGTRVTANAFHDNQSEDLFVEVDHGPFVVDNNVFLSQTSLHVNSQGGAFAHNLFCGGVNLVEYDGRQTPYMKPHSTEVAGYHDNPCGDLRFVNNIVAQAGNLSAFNRTRLPMQLAGNVFLKGAKSCALEPAPLLRPDFDPQIALKQAAGGLALEVNLEAAWAREQPGHLASSALFGLASIPQLPFERPNGAPIRIDRDFLGRPRDTANPFPGPLELFESGKQSIRLPAPPR